MNKILLIRTLLFLFLIILVFLIRSHFSAKGAQKIDYNIFSGLRGTALYEVGFSGDKPILKTHFKGDFGRIREVVAGPDGMLYISTSNLDGRGIPKVGDDKILRINPTKL